MRSIKQMMNAKPKNSKFFEYFLKHYGDSATRTVSDDEIMKNLRNFYLDLSFGNVQQEKYVQYLYSDQRIIQLAIADTDNKLTSSYIVVESLNHARNTGCQFTAIPQFNETLEEAQCRYFTYAIINKSLKEFATTGALPYLQQISLQFNNPMNRGRKGVVL